MNPLGYREPNSIPLLSRPHDTVTEKSLRNDDVVARFILRDVLIHPISATKGDIMRKVLFRCTQVEHVCRWDRKGTKHVLARCGEVIDHRYFWRKRRPFSFSAGRAGGGGWLRNRCLMAPESAPASPGHTHERVINVNTNNTSGTPRLRWQSRRFKTNTRNGQRERTHLFRRIPTLRCSLHPAHVRR